jgi:hypothetical protein
MKNNWYKPLSILVISCSLLTCIDPYYPKLDKFQSLLVVDALLTDENTSNYVRLSHTIPTVDVVPEMVSGATVTISDDLGNITTLTEKSPGVYKTDSLSFRGVANRTYTLYIKSKEGEEYKSNPCLMYSQQDIDSIYFEKGKEIVNTETQEGIWIYIDSKGESNCKYYRWSYEECWKFSVPDPQRYDYINDSTFIARKKPNQICWGNKKADEIIIESREAGINNRFEKKPILFVASEKSPRLLIQYFVQISQYAISREEYKFWYQMNQINESGGDIFDKQPFQINSNIHNIIKADEQVLGYFQVSSVKSRRKYITRNDIDSLNLPQYTFQCERIEVGPLDYPPDPVTGMPVMTFDGIYRQYTASGYSFVEPLFSGNRILLKLAFNTPYCSDCSLQGSLKEPDFWIDLE